MLLYSGEQKLINFLFCMSEYFKLFPFKNCSNITVRHFTRKNIEVFKVN